MANCKIHCVHPEPKDYSCKLPITVIHAYRENVIFDP